MVYWLFQMFPSRIIPTKDGDGATVLPEIDENSVNNLNIEINGHITSEEILHCVKNLKNLSAILL
jgi:hypothetical protein